MCTVSPQRPRCGCQFGDSGNAASGLVREPAATRPPSSLAQPSHSLLPNCGSVTTMTIMTIVGNRPMDTDLWTVAEAKAKLSQVIDEAQKRGPQTITKNGRRTVVVVDAAEWDRRTRPPGTLSDFFAASPLRGSRLKVRRSTDRLRSTDL